MHWSQLVAAVAALSSTAQAADPLPFPASCPGVTATRYQNTVDSGWKMTKLLGNLKQPRTVIWDPLGNMLVLQATKGISVHSFGADGCVNGTNQIVSNVGLNHGLSLTPDGKTLYASSQTTAWSWDYDAATQKVSNQKTVIKNIGQGIHSTRTMVVVPQAPNIVLVAVGSNNNWDYQAGSPATGRACIKAFDMSKVPAAGYNYNTDGYQMGYGLRNEVGIAIDPAGHAWGVENSGDDFRRTVNGQATDIHIDNPGEELNYLGDPTKPNNNWYGYPTCFTVWGANLIRDAQFKTGDQFVVTPNSTFSDANCAGKSTGPRLTLPAHTAPITNAFDKDGSNMYVTLHGSWDRQPASGYSVIEIPFTKTADGLFDPVAKADSQTGFKTIFGAANPGSCQSQGLQQSNCFRLAGLGWDPAGTRLMVTSDNSAEGEIFMLAKK